MSATASQTPPTLTQAPASRKRRKAPHAVFDGTMWLRLPRPGELCPVSGLSRSTLAELVRPCPRNNFTPPVDSRLIKRPGTARGVLLIKRESLLAFIEEQPAPARPAAATASASA